MQPAEFDAQVTRMSSHFGSKQFSDQFKALLWRAVEKLSKHVFEIVVDDLISHQRHVPTLIEVSEAMQKVANTSGLSGFRWKHFEVADCMTCGGCGWHWVTRPGREGLGAVACDDCRAGKNMQAAPKPHINWTMRQCRGATYAAPGRGAVHPVSGGGGA